MGKVSNYLILTKGFEFNIEKGRFAVAMHAL